MFAFITQGLNRTLGIRTKQKEESEAAATEVDSEVQFVSANLYPSEGHRRRENHTASTLCDTRSTGQARWNKSSMPGKVAGGHRPIDTLGRAQRGSADRPTTDPLRPETDSAAYPAPKRQRTDLNGSEARHTQALDGSERGRRPNAVQFNPGRSVGSSHSVRVVAQRSGDSSFDPIISNVPTAGSDYRRKKRRQPSEHEQLSPSTRNSDHTSRPGEEPALSPSLQGNEDLPWQHYRSNPAYTSEVKEPNRARSALEEGLSEIDQTSLRANNRARLAKPPAPGPPINDGPNNYQASSTIACKPQSTSGLYPYANGDVNSMVTAPSSLELRSRPEYSEIEPNIRHKFLPEDDRGTRRSAKQKPDPQKRPKIWDRMDSTYAHEQRRDNIEDSSEDELAGGAPITGSKSRTVQTPLPTSHLRPAPFITRAEAPGRRQLMRSTPRTDVSTPRSGQSECSEQGVHQSQAYAPGARRASTESPKQPSEGISSPSAGRSEYFGQNVGQPKGTAMRTTRTRIEPSRRTLESVSTSPTSSPSHSRLSQEPRRRSTRSTVVTVEEEPEVAPERWSQINRLGPWLRPVVYPANGLRRATVTCKDVERLDEGEFLNDSIIAYALRRIEELTPHRDQIHFFNSFFYTAMSTKAGSRARGLNYDAVKKWTKGKALLHKPYIIVPINYDLHWFTAIICNLPKLMKPHEVDVRDEPSEINEAMPDEASKERGTDYQPEYLQSTPEQEPQMEAARRLDSLSLDEKSPEQSAQKKAKRRIAPVRKYDPEQPSIIILDSLAMSRATEVGILKDYIVAEAADKHGHDLFDLRKKIQGVSAKNLPEQTNYCDCGVYLIAYLEAFARNPRLFVQKLLQKQIDPNVDFAGFEPSAKRAEIRNQLLALHQEQEAHRLASKQANNALQPAKHPSAIAVIEAEVAEDPEQGATTEDRLDRLEQLQHRITDHSVEQQPRHTPDDLPEQPRQHFPVDVAEQQHQEAAVDRAKQQREEAADDGAEQRQQASAVDRAEKQRHAAADGAEHRQQESAVYTSGPQQRHNAIDFGEQQQAQLHQHSAQSSKHEPDQELEQEPPRPLLDEPLSYVSNKIIEPYGNSVDLQQPLRAGKSAPHQVLHVPATNKPKVADILASKRKQRTQSRPGTHDSARKIPTESSIIEID